MQVGCVIDLEHPRYVHDSLSQKHAATYALMVRELESPSRDKRDEMQKVPGTRTTQTGISYVFVPFLTSFHDTHLSEDCELSCLFVTVAHFAVRYF